MAERLHNSGVVHWTPNRLPALSGKTYVVTGANSGIGFDAARMIAEKGGRIVLACRNMQKAADARDRLPGEGHETLELDLSDLEKVRAAADALKSRCESIDALVNNAGVMQTAKTLTPQGYELQFATNHLGHFLWTGLLFDHVEAARGRVVTVSSLVHKFGVLNFDDLMMTKRYDATGAYGQSKLANLIFALELQRRIDKAGSPVASIACHPGYSDTSLQSTGPQGALKRFYAVTNALFAQSSENGAIPTVLAAAGEEARAGGYYGPQGMMETRGAVSDAKVADRARDEAAATRLWSVSEELTGFSWSP